MAQEKFVTRHIGPRAEDLGAMLEVIGVSSAEELIDQVVPPQIRLREPIAIEPEGLSEYETAKLLRDIAAKNTPLRTFIGMGYYQSAVPAAILRNVLENPAWYTSYTPYQAEISQGRLEALLNFQTMIISLTGMEIAGCSLLDEATAAAEAMAMMFSLRSKEAVKCGRNVLFVDENIFPQTLDLLLTRCEPFEIEIVSGGYASYEFTGREFGAIVQYPGADGEICDYSVFTAAAHKAGVLVTAAADLLSLALLKPPGEWGADIVVGSAQRFGAPMWFGGPHAGYIAAKDAFKRNMPGRIIGVSIDRLGNRALRMALQTREQHIKRERATSNICTSQALMASMAGFFAVYHGAEGIRRIALNAHSCAYAVAEAARDMGYEVMTRNIFDTFRLKADVCRIKALAEAAGYNLFYPCENTVHISFDEVTTTAEVNDIIEILAAAKGVEAIVYDSMGEGIFFDLQLERQSPYLTQQVFKKYRSETALMRYIKKLERRDISLADGMIPLGSCTMKLNSAASMMSVSLAGFTDVHPFVPRAQAAGYTELIGSLERDLAAITGFAAVSLQPNSGAAGEYAGLMVIRAYHISRGEGHRNIALIPSSAHGTNPASAAMAGMKTVTVECDANGNINVDDLRVKAEQNAAELSCIMITYPSTHGVFESRICEIADIIHANGAQVYMDGANMNAQVGLTNPGYIGADVCHLNLHKTFAMPHGGGGPGVGPICVAEHLARFLPSHPIVETGGIEGITAVSAAPWGSAGILPITYAYIKMLGGKGLRLATEMAIVNANYMASAMKSEFGVMYTGETGRVAHEMIIDMQHVRKDYGVECADIARRLMDYGFHAPTLSFPVHDTLMIEPTESEPKAEMDRFIEVMTAIKRECEEILSGKSDPADNVIKNAPHTAPEATSDNWAHAYSRQKAAYPLPSIAENKFWPHVSKIDSGYGDRNLICTCED